MSCNSFTNNWNNFQNSPTPPTPPAESDRQELNNLMDMLNNPALLKEGAQGALYGLLMYAANVCQQKEVKVRSEMANQNAEITKAQGEIAQHQGDAIKAGAYAAAAGSIASGAITLSGSAISSRKMIKEEMGIKDLNKQISEKEEALSKGPETTTGETASPNNFKELTLEKNKLERERALKTAGYGEKMQIWSQGTRAFSEVTSSYSQVSSANAKASQTILETSAQQLNQASNELQNNQKTAGEVADQLTQLLTLSGNLAKAAVGR